MKSKLWIKLLLGLCISALFLWLVSRKVEFSQLISALAAANLYYLLLAVLLTILSFGVRAYRWQFFLNPIKSISLHNLFSVIMIGFMANNILPFRLGEFVRAYTISKKEKISKSASFATIVVERVFDLAVLFLLLWITLFLIEIPWLGKHNLLVNILMIIVFSGLIIFLLLLNFKLESVLKLFAYIPLSEKLHNKSQELLKSFAEGLRIFHNIKNVLKALFSSLLVWLLVIMNYWAGLESFKEIYTIPWYGGLVVTVFIALGMSLPASPGFIGIIQAAIVTALSVLVIDKAITFESDALACGIALHATQFIPITIIGMIYFWKEHLSFKEISSVQEEESQEV